MAFIIIFAGALKVVLDAGFVIRTVGATFVTVANESFNPNHFFSIIIVGAVELSADLEAFDEGVAPVNEIEL